MNKAAQALGRLAKGVPKTMTPAAIAARKANGKKGGRPRKNRWADVRRGRKG